MGINGGLPAQIGETLLLKLHDVIHPDGYNPGKLQQVFSGPAEGVQGVAAGVKGDAIIGQ